MHKDFLSGVCEAIIHSVVLQRSFGSISPMNVFPMGLSGATSRLSVGGSSHHDRQCDDYSSFKSFSYLRCNSPLLKQKLDREIGNAVQRLRDITFRSIGRLSIRLFTVKEGWGTVFFGPWKRGSLWEEWLLDIEPDMENPASVEEENLRQEEMETTLQRILFNVVHLAACSRDISPHDPKLLHDFAPFIGYDLEIEVTDMRLSPAQHASLFSQIMPVLGAAAATGTGRS